MADHNDNRLTLFTADQAITASDRLVVTATLGGDPFRATALHRGLDPEGDVDQSVSKRAVLLGYAVELDHGAAAGDPSARVNASRTAAGSARPPVFFMTCPTSQPNVCVLPER